MKEGENTIEAYARSTDGTDGPARGDGEASCRAPSAQALTPRQVAQRNRLLENRLLDLQRRSVEIQAEANEDVRRELQVEIEKERKAAEESTAKVRKEIEVSGREEAQAGRRPRPSPLPNRATSCERLARAYAAARAASSCSARTPWGAWRCMKSSSSSWDSK